MLIGLQALLEQQNEVQIEPGVHKLAYWRTIN